MRSERPQKVQHSGPAGFRRGELDATRGRAGFSHGKVRYRAPVQGTDRSRRLTCGSEVMFVSLCLGPLPARLFHVAVQVAHAFHPATRREPKPGAVPRRVASEETRSVLRAPSGRDRTGKTQEAFRGVDQVMVRNRRRPWTGMNVSIGIVIGTAIGAAIGSSLDAVVGTALGVGLGVGLAALMRRLVRGR